MRKAEERDVVLENLREKYPEDFNSDYNCYIWSTQGLDENKKPIGEVRYWTCVKDKWLATETDPNGKTILLKGYEDANKLDQLLALFFTL